MEPLMQFCPPPTSLYVTTVEGTDLTGLYNDVPTMQEYSKLMQFLGDYYQVTPG